MGCFFDEIQFGYCEMSKNKLDELDKKTRKAMTMNKKLHPRTDPDRLYISSMDGLFF